MNELTDVTGKVDCFTFVDGMNEGKGLAVVDALHAIGLLPINAVAVVGNGNLVRRVSYSYLTDEPSVGRFDLRFNVDTQQLTALTYTFHKLMSVDEVVNLLYPMKPALRNLLRFRVLDKGFRFMDFHALEAYAAALPASDEYAGEGDVNYIVLPYNKNESAARLILYSTLYREILQLPTYEGAIGLAYRGQRSFQGIWQDRPITVNITPKPMRSCETGDIMDLLVWYGVKDQTKRHRKFTRDEVKQLLAGLRFDIASKVMISAPSPSSNISGLINLLAM